LSLALIACGPPPVEAPKEIGELGAFLFKSFENEDPAEMEAGLIELRAFLQGENITAEDPFDRALSMPVLKGEDLGSLSIPEGAEADKQVNVALPGLSSHTPEASKVLHVEANQVCIESDTTLFANRQVLAGGDCWVDGGCDSLETLTEVYKKNFLAEVWYDQYKNYRVVTLNEEDGSTTEVVVGRAWIDQVFPAVGGGNNSWDQLFSLDISIPNPDDPSTTLRWFAMWSSITLFPLTDDGYYDLVVEGIDQSYVFADEFVSGEMVTCENDREMAPPVRE